MEEYKYEDCRFMKWPGGWHWYVKCGDVDVCDKWNNQKFKDIDYAQEIAKEWCLCGGNWNKEEENEKESNIN